MPLRFALHLQEAQLERWQLDCLQPLLALAEVRPVLLIDAGDGSGASVATEANGPYAGRVALPAPLAGLARVRAESQEEIRAAGLDFILSFSTARCPEALLEAARWGVWRYLFGDWQRLRGGPVGFWEVYTGEPVSAALFVRLTSRADAVVVLREGYLRTSALSPATNRARLLGSFTHWPAQVCRDVTNGHTDRFTAPPLVTRTPERHPPTRLQHLVCAGRILVRTAAEGYRSLFRHTQWNVGIVDQPIASFLSGAPRVRWLPAPKRWQFLADPFGVVREGRLTILLEDFSYVTNRGTISAVDVATGTTLPVSIGPQPPVHLSYPYLLEADGRLYCIPESHEAHEVTLYEVERFPDRWKRVATFPIDKVIVDATLFRHEEHWWIAGSEPGIKGASSELHLWYAPAIGGPWRPHEGNPVKIDIRSARPAGTPFRHAGSLYRPAQDCSRSYGGRITLNRVIALTPTAFREETVGTVEPDTLGPYREGIHTLSSVGDLTLVDGKRTLLVAEELRRVARHFLRKALLRINSRAAPGAPPASD